MSGENKELSTVTITFMVLVALFYDALQVVLSWIGGGWLITPIAYLTFFIWFKMRGLSFLSLKRAPTLGIGGLLEIASAGIIPAFTFIVLRISLDYKIKKFLPINTQGKIPSVSKFEKAT